MATVPAVVVPEPGTIPSYDGNPEALHPWLLCVENWLAMRGWPEPCAAGTYRVDTPWSLVPAPQDKEGVIDIDLPLSQQLIAIGFLFTGPAKIWWLQLSKRPNTWLVPTDRSRTRQDLETYVSFRNMLVARFESKVLEDRAWGELVAARWDPSTTTPWEWRARIEELMMRTGLSYDFDGVRSRVHLSLPDPYMFRLFEDQPKSERELWELIDSIYYNEQRYHDVATKIERSPIEIKDTAMEDFCIIEGHGRHTLKDCRIFNSIIKNYNDSKM